jgi:protocatechuate 4,5-dioxygenase beta chain
VSTVVGGFWMPHNPVMYLAPDAPDPVKSAAVAAAYESCAERLAALNPDSVIIIGCDHYILFGTSCLPKYLIGTGDVDGPIDQLPGLRRQAVVNDRDLALQLTAHGDKSGFDYAVARAFTTDHSFSIPHQLVVQRAEKTLQRILPSVPLYLACGVDPYISMQRARQLGENIAEAVTSDGASKRVAVIGSGGISHWVGTAETGRVNEDFDRQILGFGEAADLDGLCALTDEYIIDRGGNGGMEVRNFACAMAACRAGRGEIIAYEAVPEWVTGFGFLEMHGA